MAEDTENENPQDYNLTNEQAQRILSRFFLKPSQLRDLDEEIQKQLLWKVRLENKPALRAQHLALFQRGDDGEIAADGHTKAAEHLAGMRQLLPDTPTLRGRVGGIAAGPGAQPSPTVVLESQAGLAPDNTGWKSLGPGNIGGRIRSILIDPTDTDRIYIGSVGGGVWISTDGGQNWQPGDDLMANLAVASMVMDPNNSSLIYAGTGEGCNYSNPTLGAGDAIQGNGIFKTSNGWVWEQLDATKATATNTDFLWVNGLTINSDSSVMLAGTRTGIFRSTDAGDTWTKAMNANVGNILFDPSDETKAVAGLLNSGGIYFSTDSGDTWTQATEPAGTSSNGRSQICYAAKDTSFVYASVQAPGGSQIWLSTDGGQVFTKKNNTTNYLGTQGDYDNIIWAGDPSNENFVIVGGIDLYKSTNGGNSLVQISRWQSSPRSAHADQHMIFSDPGYNGTTNKIVYFGNDGGLYKTLDVSTVGSGAHMEGGWISLNTKLPITQFYSVSGKLNPAGNAIASIVGGAQDNGSMRYTPANGANSWNTWYGGDGGYVSSDATSADNYYGEYVYLDIFRSTNGGLNAESISGSYWNGFDWDWKPVPYTITDAQNTTAQFIAPFLLDPNDASRLIGGGQSLWITTDPLTATTNVSGPTWTIIKPPIDPYISAIAIARGNSNLMLVGYTNGRIYKSTNATAAAPVWARADSGINANRVCSWLVIDDNDPTRFYATFGGFQDNNVWTSSDSGSSWSNLGALLPKVPIFCIAVHPQNAEWLYLGTESGIFASEDRGANWSPTNEGPTNCLIYQLFWLNNTLVCASHGRGMFSNDLTIHNQANLVIAGDIAGNLTAANAQSGATVTSFAMPSGQITAAPLVDENEVYCAYAQPFGVAKYADAHNLAAGPVWQAVLGGSVNASPALVKGIFPGDKDLVYSIAANGKLYVLDAATGNQEWELQVVPTAVVGAGVSAYSNQMMNQWIYIATEKGFFAVNTLTRQVGWNANYICKAPPLLASDTVFAPTQSGKIYSVDARTGAENWNYDTGSPVASTPVWVLGSVIAGNQAGTLVGLDYITGALQFTQSFVGEQIMAIAADGNEIYFSGNAIAGHLYSYSLTINGATRTINQNWKVDMVMGASRAPQIVGTSLYVTTTDTKLEAFNTISGANLWQETLPRVALAAPSLVYA